MFRRSSATFVKFISYTPRSIKSCSLNAQKPFAKLYKLGAPQYTTTSVRFENKKNLQKSSYEHEQRKQKPFDEISEPFNSNQIVKPLEKQKPVKNEPFIKNVFTGIYKYEYLKYPEFENNIELENLIEKNVDPIRNYIQNSSYAEIIGDDGNFTSNALKKFKSLNIFGNSIPQKFGGQELDHTGVARILEETGRYPALGLTLIYNNEIVAKSITIYGTEDQKKKYLPLLARGETLGGFCFSEVDNGLDLARFKCTSIVKNPQANLDKQKFILNGRKAWVSLLSDSLTPNGEFTGNAVFLVIATTIMPGTEIQHEEIPDSEVNLADPEHLRRNLVRDKNLNAFLVDSSTRGVRVLRQHASRNGLNLFEVEFNNVELDSVNLLGNVNSGFEISSKITENARYLAGAVCVGLLKDLLQATVRFAIETTRFEKPLSENLSIKDTIANVECKLHAMDSMVYLLAGILDSYQDADVSCESALTKAYCSETLRTCANQLLDILAMGTYSTSSSSSSLVWIDQVRNSYIQSLSYFSNIFSTNEVLKQFAATNAVLAAGSEYSDEVFKLRNPFMYPAFILRRLVTTHRTVKAANRKVPEYFFLWEHVHPSLNGASSALEQMAIKLNMAVKMALANHGNVLSMYQLRLRQLADMTTQVWALNAVIGRASRSYSIGLPNAQHEVELAHLFAQGAQHKFNKIYDDATDREGRLENIRMNVASKVFVNKQHVPAHPIARNY